MWKYENKYEIKKRALMNYIEFMRSVSICVIDEIVF